MTPDFLAVSAWLRHSLVASASLTGRSRCVPDAALTFSASVRLTLAGFIHSAQKSQATQVCGKRHPILIDNGVEADLLMFICGGLRMHVLFHLWWNIPFA
ncbi:hypothetical protein BTJ39_12665 [Izhakiella australiensis]|uniref:Uncharacterized protein n=1 Tax=Izhakiella australiensis TaxID=1926881 RepID=A0A1S8YKW7_9GAMM|nr:hypothetical protein BTJ39_12665 [Izhakiella australiensis]